MPISSGVLEWDFVMADDLVVKIFIKEKDLQFLSSGSKNLKDKIILDSNSDIFIWGVVTYVIHALH